jgi:UDP-N-acetylmuramate: L-alanyl-gamma-D-glutamyl-meso-diaminopimelate ligase
MGALAGLLKEAGHRVTGSDSAFYPPMGDALVRWGIETKTGFRPENLEPAPDLVVIGNVCRPSNPEAVATIERGLRYVSMAGAIAELFLQRTRSFVVAGTHGKTTTSALLAYLLEATGAQPGFLVGGIPADFAHSFRAGQSGGPFVIEGDEYDSAFFEKTPKLWQYRPEVAIVHAIEHDHIDIYPDMASYRHAFARFVELMPEHGLLIANAADPEVRAVAARARCSVSYYALDGEDTGDVSPTWLAAPCKAERDHQPFDLFYGGSHCGRVMSPLSGHHNIKNAIAAIAAAAEGMSHGPDAVDRQRNVAVRDLVAALLRFGGVRRRQELRGVAGGVRIYDDFAHHPTAVAQTLAGLRDRHPEGTLIALFEPRSSTASRKLHQLQYPPAFAPADLTLLAPVGRAEIAEAERLDVARIAEELEAVHGKRAAALPSIDAIVERVLQIAKPGDTVVAMSNGAFGGVHDKLLAALAARDFSAKLASSQL